MLHFQVVLICKKWAADPSSAALLKLHLRCKTRFMQNPTRFAL